jgi:hypothetical protein
VLEEMRAALARWMADTADLGLVPEPELVARMQSGRTTDDPAATPGGGRFHGPVEVTLRSATEGASIEYTTERGDHPRWRLYDRPLRLSSSALLRARAGRLGFYDSGVVEVAFEIGE